MNAQWTFINDAFVTTENASLHISDLSIQRGYGVFDFFRTINHIPLYIDQHLNRLYYSAQKMRLALNLLPGELKDIIHALIKKNDMPGSGIRITLTGGYSPDAYQLAKPNLIITQQAFTATNSPQQKGVKLITYNYRRDVPDVKTINYTMGIWLQPLIKEKGADEVLYYHDNIISECPRANFFIVDKNDMLLTPAHHILKGITRKNIIALAKPYYKVIEKDITLNDISQAKEAFITSTTKQILPVLKIDEYNIGKSTHSVTQHIAELLAACQEKYLLRADA